MGRTAGQRRVAWNDDEGDVDGVLRPAKEGLGAEQEGAEGGAAEKPPLSWRCHSATLPGLGPSTRWRHSLRPQQPPLAHGERPERPPAAPVPGQRLPKQPEPIEATEILPSELCLDRNVGSGGTAEVFKGTWRGHTVAIKQMLRHRKMDEREKISFEREVTVLAAITHPNLVKLYGIALREKPLRIVTEFCRGGTVFDLIYNCGVLSWPQKMKICIDTACGMDYLHTFRPLIIHRDLKSLNLLLDQRVKTTGQMPVVKVADFGLSRMQEPGRSWGQMTAQVGTWQWMAPEVFAGTDYNESCDVYSYAMCMYEAVCQEVPFEELDPGKIGTLTMRGVRPNLRCLPPNTPQDLEKCMASCWAQDGDRRPSFAVVLATLIKIDVASFRGIAASAFAGSSPQARALVQANR